MGILTRLRNAFGKSRKGDAAAAAATPAAEPSVPAARQETAPEPAPAAPEPEATVPAPATEPKASVVEDLVSAAFDNVTVPKQSSPTAEQETKAEPTKKAKAKPVAEAKAEAKPAVEAEPVAEPAVETKPEPVAEAEPVVEAEPEPVVEAKAEPVVEPEPVVEAKAEPVVEPEQVAEPEAEVKPEPVVEAEAEPEAKAEPVVAAEPEAVEAEAEAEVKPEPVVEPEPVVADVTPEPEPVIEPEPEPVVAEVAPEAEPVTAQVDEPVAADGDEAPQGPPAADDESVTGGAGGKTDADEGEAESEVVAPATTLAKVKAHAPGLLTAYKAATSTLEKHNLAGTRAKVYLVLDRSASMRPYYKDGSAQALGEQTLALAAHLDPTATVHVVFFSTELDGTGELALPDHENKIDELHAGLGRMGRTSYHAAVQEVLTHHEKSDAPTAPALVIFQTDGAPDAKTPATQSLTDAAKNHPGVFFSFVAFGEQDNKAFDYLRKLKTDNTAFFHAGPTPRELTDTEVYEGVLANWRP
ncbi:VWA domain-containing protein [Streptomyces sp. NPDC050597]|uniref:VWA domain-containing protein n=1 Tax=Streptomyces sp. NPDC050597 TaxID=3157212 RepID=UPI003418A03E